MLASYTYATNGTRSSMTENGVTTSFTLDGRRCVNEAVGSSNTPTLFGPTGPITRGTQWFTPDASGSIAAVTDGTGLPVAQNCYGVFGQMATTNPNSGDPLQYLGGMNDTAVGLDYLGAKSAWSPNLGQDLGGFGQGVAGCVGHAVTGALSSLTHHAANPLSPITDPIATINGLVQAVRQKGLLLAVLDPITNTLQQLGDWSSPEAAGNSLCNDTFTALPIVGAVGGGGGGGVDVPPVETPPVATPAPPAGGPEIVLGLPGPAQNLLTSLLLQGREVLTYPFGLDTSLGTQAVIETAMGNATTIHFTLEGVDWSRWQAFLDQYAGQVPPFPGGGSDLITAWEYGRIKAIQSLEDKTIFY